MEVKNKNILMEVLHDMEDFAKLKGLSCPPIYLLGGSGCIVGGYINRATLDFDILDMDYSASTGRIFKMLGDVDYLDLNLTTIAPGFKERAVKIKEFVYLEIYVLSKEDIITTKIGRYSEKDMEDISKLIKYSSKDLVLKLINIIMDRADISPKVRKIFIKNATLFRRDFNV